MHFLILSVNFGWDIFAYHGNEMDITIVKLDKVVSLLVTLNIYTFFYCFYCWLWTGECLLGNMLFVATHFIHSASVLLRQPVLHFIHSAQVLLITYRYVLTKACCILYLFSMSTSRFINDNDLWSIFHYHFHFHCNWS